MNAAVAPSANPGSELARPTVSFPRYTLRDLLIEVFYHKRIMIIAFLIPVVLGIVAAILSKPSYVAQARLLVLYGSEYFYNPVAGQASSSVALDRNEIMLGELQVMQSTTLAIQTLQTVGPDRVYPGLKADTPAGLAQGALRMARDLNLSSIAQSNILELSFRSYDPGVAADVLRALIDNYLARRRSIFARAPTPAAQTDQDAYLNRLHAAEAEITKFSNAHNIGNFDEQMRLLLQMQTTNRQSQDEVAQSISETAARLATIRQQAPHIPVNVQLTADSDRTQESRFAAESLVLLQAKRRDLASRYQSTFPQVQDLDRQVAALQNQIARDPSHQSAEIRSGRNPVAEALQTQQLALESQLQGLTARQGQLKIAGDSIAGRVTEFNQSAEQYRDLQRTRDLLDQTYRALVRSNEDAQIAHDAEQNRAANVRVVQPPERPPVGRSLGVILVVVGVVVGLIAAFAALAVSHALKQVFVSARDVIVILELPVLVAVGRPSGGLFKRGPAQRAGWGKQAAHGTVGA